MSLVSVAEVAEYGGVESTADGTLLQRLIDQAEAAFLRAVGRVDRPFQAKQDGRVEVLDGTGSSQLFLAYPIAALTALITLGYASPWDETLDPADSTLVVWAVGRRVITRVDGGCWTGRPLYVRVTYDAAADEPEDVKLAIARRVAALYRESGAAEPSGERRLQDTEDLPRVDDPDPTWQDAVEAHLVARA